MNEMTPGSVRHERNDPKATRSASTRGRWKRTGDEIHCATRQVQSPQVDWQICNPAATREMSTNERLSLSTNVILQMLRNIRRSVLRLQRSSGMFRLVADSKWRRNRLLILCYHGISRLDEHLWRPNLYMRSEIFQERLEILERGRYNVLALREALQRLEAGQLPPRSLVITFDDGGYDFYAAAFPVIRRFGVPVTVYQTTYYGERPFPIFNLAFSYLLWQRRGRILTGGSALGIDDVLDLRTEDSRAQIVRNLVLLAEQKGLSGTEKNGMVASLARFLSLSYEVLVASRRFQIMTAAERSELAEQGIDFQLHTHRHRTPLDEDLFRREIRDNRNALRELGANAVHFCYPSGVYRPEFLPWLQKENVLSATTSDVGFATRHNDFLLLPRLVDTAARMPLEFEAWLSGVALWTSLRKPAAGIPPIAAGMVSQANNSSQSVSTKGCRVD
jgi:peptidoglycan/xylan/chitin deacetylase (PgdA/CDA1 family)